MKFAIKYIQHYPSHPGVLLHYLGKFTSHFCADIQQLWKKMQTNFDISVFKIASLSPY